MFELQNGNGLMSSNDVGVLGHVMLVTGLSPALSRGGTVVTFFTTEGLCSLRMGTLQRFCSVSITGVQVS